MFWQAEKGGIGAGPARKRGVLDASPTRKKGGLMCGSGKKGGSLPRNIPKLKYMRVPPENQSNLKGHT